MNACTSAARDAKPAPDFRGILAVHDYCVMGPGTALALPFGIRVILAHARVHEDPLLPETHLERERVRVCMCGQMIRPHAGAIAQYARVRNSESYVATRLQHRYRHLAGRDRGH